MLDFYMLRIEYEIKTSPDPENPNEQPEGTEIVDDRLYGASKLILVTNEQAINKAAFVKNKLSNKLTLSSGTFYNGQIIILTGEQFN